ncbi:MAG: hypothetical protein OXS30_00465 [Chloroflexota bacterium]|nr:hypothetical protein [Chloroflexota bacterium]
MTTALIRTGPDSPRLAWTNPDEIRTDLDKTGQIWTFLDSSSPNSQPTAALATHPPEKRRQTHRSREGHIV